MKTKAFNSEEEDDSFLQLLYRCQDTLSSCQMNLHIEKLKYETGVTCSEEFICRVEAIFETLIIEVKKIEFYLIINNPEDDLILKEFRNNIRELLKCLIRIK
jgi:hypothetical protein